MILWYARVDSGFEAVSIVANVWNKRNTSLCWVNRVNPTLLAFELSWCRGTVFDIIYRWEVLSMQANVLNPMLRDRFSVIVFSLGHWLLWWKWQLTVLLVPTPCTQCNFFHGWNQISHTLHKHSEQMWGSDPADYLIENVQLWTWRISPEPLNVMEQFQISRQSHTRLGNQKISSIGLCPATEILHLQKQTCICISHWILTSWKNFKTSLMLINSSSLS